MNKLVYSALTMTIVGAPGLGSGNDETEWLSLDKELEELNSSLVRSQSDGPRIGGFVYGSFRYGSDTDGNSSNGGVPQDDLFDPPPNGSELGGFQLDDTRVWVEGNVDSYGYYVSLGLFGAGGVGAQQDGSPAENGEVELLDAYVTWQIGDTVKGWVGRFKQPFIRSGMLMPDKLIFGADATPIGDSFRTREEGLMFTGEFDLVNWYVALQNDLQGTGDGTGDRFLITGRVDLNLIGGGTAWQEGAIGAPDQTALTVGLAAASDTGHKNGNHFAIDAALTTGRFYGDAEVAFFDEGSDADAAGTTHFFGPTWDGTPGVVHIVDGVTFDGTDVSDTNPWSVTVAYLITREEWEVAFRYADSDNENDDTTWMVGLNRYVKSHDIKWSVFWTQYDTDTRDATGSTVDTGIFSVALGLSF
jgi:hypothetical protein